MIKYVVKDLQDGYYTLFESNTLYKPGSEIKIRNITLRIITFA